MNAIYWLILFIVLLGVEIVTLGLTTIWFAGGALAAFVAALLGANLWLELTLFCVVSFALLFCPRPVAVKWLNRDRVMTNVDSLIGQTAIVTKTIRNLQGEGEVKLNGMTWTARAGEDSRELEEGKVVRVLQVRGVKLIVEEAQKQEISSEETPKP